MPVKQQEVGRGLAHMFPHGPQKQQSGMHFRSLHIPAAVSSSVTLFPLILKGTPLPETPWGVPPSFLGKL